MQNRKELYTSTMAEERRAVDQRRQICAELNPTLCKRFVSNQVRLGLFVLAYNLRNFLRRLVLPKKIKHWSFRSLLVKLIKIGAKIARHGRYVTFQMAEVAIDKRLFAEILARIKRLRCYSV